MKAVINAIGLVVLVVGTIGTIIMAFAHCWPVALVIIGVITVAYSGRD